MKKKIKEKKTQYRYFYKNNFHLFVSLENNVYPGVKLILNEMGQFGTIWYKTLYTDTRA